LESLQKKLSNFGKVIFDGRRPEATLAYEVFSEPCDYQIQWAGFVGTKPAPRNPTINQRNTAGSPLQ
jgi:hypothetical protein